MAATRATLAGCRGGEAQVEGADGRVPADGGEGGHVQDVAHVGAAAGDLRRPRMAPQSRLTGATPTRAAIRRRSRRPSSGSSAIRVRAVIVPMPGTEVSRSSAARQAGSLDGSSISVSSSAELLCSAASGRSMPTDQPGLAPGAGGCSPCRSSRRAGGGGRPARRAARAARPATGRGSGRTARRSGRSARHPAGRSWRAGRWRGRSRGSGAG